MTTRELIGKLIEEADRLANALNDPGLDNATAAGLINGWYFGVLRKEARLTKENVDAG